VAKAEVSLWTTKKMDLSKGLDDLKNRLNDNERHFISHGKYCTPSPAWMRAYQQHITLKLMVPANGQIRP
jgi:hypothetical protein